MQKYQKTYLTAAGFEIDDSNVINEIVSELSGTKADDIHHIKYLMSGVERQDYPFERLIALTRKEHEKFGDKKQYFDYLLWAHYIWTIENTIHVPDIDYLPECIFYWDESYTDQCDMTEFWKMIVSNKMYIEFWEMPDHCLMQIYNFAGNKIKEFRKQTKKETLSASIKSMYNNHLV